MRRLIFAALVLAVLPAFAKEKQPELFVGPRLAFSSDTASAGIAFGGFASKSVMVLGSVSMTKVDGDSGVQTLTVRGCPTKVPWSSDSRSTAEFGLTVLFRTKK